MRTVKFLVVEGLDRTGKDTLSTNFGLKTNVKPMTINRFTQINTETYYGITREQFKSQDRYFVSEVGKAMAIAEFMQMLSHIIDYSERNEFVVARSFVSTVVFDWVRGINHSGLSDTILMILKNFEIAHNLVLDLRLLKLYVSREEQMNRGSSYNSFEQNHYDRIKTAFEAYKNPFIFDDHVMELDTTDLTPIQVFERAKTFLFT
jgi:thymidylate kinase